MIESTVVNDPERLSRSLVELVRRAPTAVLLVRSDGRIEYANDAASELFGRTLDDICTHDYGDLIITRTEDRDAEGSRFHFPGAVAKPFQLPVVALHRNGARLEVTIEMVDLSSADPDLVGLIVRDTVTVHRTVRRLGATVELLATALSQPNPATIEARAVELGRHVLDADVCLIRHPDGRSTHHRIDRVHVPHLPDDVLVGLGDGIGLLEPERVTRLADDELDRLANAVPVDDLPLTEMVVTPVRQGGVTYGHLAAIRVRPTPPFPAYAEHMTSEFSNAVAMAFDLWRTRDELDRLHWMGDHDRIARDLHDTVIQRLFSTGLRLEAAIPVSDELTAARIEDAASEIDGVIRDIRTAIFNLRRPATSNGGLRAAVAAEVDGFARAVGFVPRLRFDGVIDGSTLPASLSDAVVAVVRELLANVGKHSQADEVEVAVSVADGALHLTVVDDGLGIPEERTNGDGLANLAGRAHEFGGRFEIGNHDRGAIAQWSVPLPNGATGGR